MSVAPFVVELVVAAIITLVVLHQYGNWRKQHWIATLAVLISWFFSFLIVFILPLDVSAACYRECMLRQGSAMVIPAVNSSQNSTPFMNHSSSTTEFTCERPWSFMPKYVLPDMWRIVYWSSQILSWLILPMMQSYVYAGEFTVLGKIKRALYENALWYGSYLVIFGILLIYVAVRPELTLDGEQLKIIGITASNTWGLLLLVLLLGYGLVEIPRNAWNASLPGHRLSYSYFKISKLSTEKEEAEEQLANALDEVTKASEEIRYNSNLRKYVDTIISKCPDASQEMFNKGTDDYIDYDDVHGKTHVVFSEKALVKLHRKVIVVTHREHRAQAQWNNLLQKSFDLEDVEKNRENRERMYKTSFSDHQPRQSVFLLGLKWYWKIWIQAILFRLLSILLLLFSIALVWSEVTFFSTTPSLSIFAILTGVAKEGYLYFYIELVCFFTVAYMCACTYYTVFKMRLFNYYYFASKHQTDENSLLFSGILLCRLTYALSLNFLALIHLDGHVTNINTVEETSFTSFMGHMDVMSIISKGLNVYYPMTVLLVCLCTFFHLGSRILHCFGVQQFLIDEDLSTEYINEGKDIVRRERRRIQKAISGGKDWSQRATQILQKFSSSSRDRDRRIDDDTDDTRSHSHTKLSEPKATKYSKYGEDDDRVQLLDNIEYEPTVVRGSGYTGLSGMTRSSAPKNIFDDI